MATTIVMMDVAIPTGTATAGLPVAMTTTAIAGAPGITMIVRMPPIPVDVVKTVDGSVIPKGMQKPPVVAGMNVKDRGG